MAVAAIIFALLGFRVDCVCYSEYLSNRDYKAFLNFFKLFAVDTDIEYHTFQKLSEKYINKFGNVRDLTINVIKNEKPPIQI